MKPKYPRVWISFGFAAFLAGIFVLSGYAQPGPFPAGPPIGLALFVCLLPMCFFFAANALSDTRNRIETLEARIKQLETEKQV